MRFSDKKERRKTDKREILHHCVFSQTKRSRGLCYKRREVTGYAANEQKSNRINFFLIFFIFFIKTFLCLFLLLFLVKVNKN